MQTPHLDAAYEAEIQAIRVRLARTAARAEQMVRDAVRALLTRDPALAREVIGTDRELNRLEVELDYECVMLLARRSPVGEDLRLVLTALKADVDMERIGDLAVVVATTAAHRGDAFAASRDLIDTLKAEVPIWKHQVFDDASEEWVGTP